MVAIEEIQDNPFQPRRELDEEGMQELAESIKIHGIIQPITLRHIGGGKYQIISGERRFRASRRIGLEEVPAYIRVADDQAMLELALIENIQRKDLNPIEIAITYKRLMDECDLTHESLADRVSKKRSTVSNYLRLLKLPPVIQHALKDRKLSMGHARALVSVPDVTVQLDVLDKILKRGMSVRAVESYIQQQNKKSKPTAPQKEEAIDPNLIAVQDELASRFGTKVSLKQSASGKGQIVIHFNSTSELNNLLEIMEELE
jgi:ParB family chromosome partitioning protein